MGDDGLMTDKQFGHIMMYLNIVAMMVAKSSIASMVFMVLAFLWLIITAYKDIKREITENK